MLVAGLFKKSWARLDRAGNWIHGQSLVLLNSYFQLKSSFLLARFVDFECILVEDSPSSIALIV